MFLKVEWIIAYDLQFTDCLQQNLTQTTHASLTSCRMAGSLAAKS
jgi:hypothetical protein